MTKRETEPGLGLMEAPSTSLVAGRQGSQAWTPGNSVQNSTTLMQQIMDGTMWTVTVLGVMSALELFVQVQVHWFH